MTSPSLPGFEAQGPTGTVTLASVLRTLTTKDRILVLARGLGLNHLSSRQTIAQLAAEVQKARPTALPELLSHLLRDELRKALEAHDLDTEGRSRRELARRLLAHSGEQHRVFEDDDAPAASPHTPRPGRLALVRQRQYLITGVHPPPISDDATASRPVERVELVCLDDDAQGRELDVFWPLELGARVIEPGSEGLGRIDRLDDPARFGAYLHTMRWNSVSATDNQLFQSPFRAGIQLKTHQIPPLSKALDLPRANLFIADDVGLGKTIEAGLVLQELILRGQVERVLIVTPASITLQWRDEMERRFGLRFEIMNRAFVARRRRERGFGVNPWSTHSRFIVSYDILRRPEYLEPLLHQLTDRARRSLLILDEAHTVAPASGSQYAVDSAITRTVRDLAGRFDNRLFLSATPHNGHSNSFSALLEVLDPARFTRGVPITGPEDLSGVMVRRLKSDLKALGADYPDRHIIRVELTHEGDGWRSKWKRADETSAATADLGPGSDAEVRLAELLRDYTQVAKPLRKRGRLVFVSLQKRLLSSIEAFQRTLKAHARWLDDNPTPDADQLGLADQTSEAEDDASVDAAREDADTYGTDDDALDSEEAAEVEARSRDFEPANERALRLLREMCDLAEAHRHEQSPKLLALLHWLGESCCPAVAPDVRKPSAEQRRWANRRIIIFTEYGDTKRYLRERLREAISGTDRAGERILEIHGGMGDDERADVQEAFNHPDSPARILLATDAAREGVNLHGACADLFHYDVPWNPARLEQRNGRIDRTGQPEPVVRCHYFTLPQRPEDRVLDILVAKVESIQTELGSLGTIVLDQVERTLADGIDAETAGKLEETDADPEHRATAQRELEQARNLESLQREMSTAQRRLQNSSDKVGVDPDALRMAVEVGCRLAGAGRLEKTTVDLPGDRSCEAWLVPHEKLTGWERTIDTLRPPRPRDMKPWDWRRDFPPRPVVFKPTDRMNDPVVHLHLEHPFVKRALSRFRAQGYGQTDLSRASIVRVPDLYEPRVVAYARLSLFGKGARRLHDEMVTVSAPWTEADAGHGLTPYEGETHARTEALLGKALVQAARDDDAFPEARAERMAPFAADDFAALWPALESEADARAAEAAVDLEARGRKDAEALREILTRQKKAIDDRIGQLQLDLRDDSWDPRERRQLDRDRQHMEARRAELDREAEEEPRAVEELFQVELRRIVPVGLVYLWPESRS
ncbi:MAG: DISARM system SNF2-like helicase DrmD [Myxococcota bacterium]